MNINTMLSRFDEMRSKPFYPPVIQIVKADGITRLSGPFEFITHWAFTGNECRERVQQQAEYAKRHNKSLSWRVYSHDKPDNLEETLSATGFVAGADETLMVFPLNSTAPLPQEHEIYRLRSADELPALLEVSAAAFGELPPWDWQFFSALIKQDAFRFYLAYRDGKAVAAGRLEIPADSHFALMFGGCVISAYRGRGLFRSLVAHRAREAQVQGASYLSTEAFESSRPILEKLGFRPLVKARRWTLAANGTPAT